MHLTEMLVCLLLLYQNTSISETERDLLEEAMKINAASAKLPKSSVTRHKKYYNDTLVASYISIHRRAGDMFLVAKEVEFDLDTTQGIDGFCFARNSRYYFSLRQGKSTKWTVVDTAVPAPDLVASVSRIWKAPYRDDILKPREKVTSDIVQFMDFHSLDMLELLPGLRISSVARQPDGLVRICYTFTHYTLFPGRKHVAAQAVILADPSYRYSTKHFEMRCSDKDLEIERNVTVMLSILESNVYVKNVDCREKIKYNAHTTKKHDVTETIEISWIDPPEEKFTLSAFGLQEPYGVEPPIRPTPWWLYAGIAAGVLLVLLFLLGLWKRRLLARG
jgi:hypothetical protein